MTDAPENKTDVFTMITTILFLCFTLSIALLALPLYVLDALLEWSELP